METVNDTYHYAVMRVFIWIEFKGGMIVGITDNSRQL